MRNSNSQMDKKILVRPSCICPLLHLIRIFTTTQSHERQVGIPIPLTLHCGILDLRSAEVSASPSIHHFGIPRDHPVSRAPSEHLLSFSLDFTLQKAWLAKRRSEHFPHHFRIPHDHTASRAPSEHPYKTTSKPHGCG